jgi:cytochrome c-type biogenesis protein CcmF
MADRRDDGVWTVRTYVHPLVPFLWIGCTMLFVGGLVSLSDRRLRVGAPTRRRLPVAAPQPAE